MNINPRLLVNRFGKLLHDVFVPRPLQDVEKKLVFDIEVLELLINANNAISRLDEMLKEIDIYQLPYFKNYCLKKETVCSLEINGQNVSLEKLMTAALGADQNDESYRHCILLQEAIGRAETDKINVEFIKDIHRRMITKQTHYPGQFRTGCNMINTYYRHNRIHPPLDEEIEESMVALVNYATYNHKTNYLIKTALIHYQFTTIHPFVDGNKRMVRILNLLYLHQTHKQGNFVFCLSLYILNHLKEYYLALTDVRIHGNYQGWVEFYLQAIVDVCNYLRQTLIYSKELLKRNRVKIVESSYSNTVKSTLVDILDFLVFNPVTTVKMLCSVFNKSHPAVSGWVKGLVDLGILESAHFYRHSRLYVYREQFNILNRL